MLRPRAGRLGSGGGPASGRVLGLFPAKPQVLEEGEGELAQEQGMVQSAPAPALEVVELQLVLQWLVHRLADPSIAARSIRLRGSAGLLPGEGGRDQRGQELERRVSGVFCQIVLALTAGAMLANEPSFLTGQVLRPRCHRSISDPHAKGSEVGLARALGPGSPRDGAKRFRPGLEQLGGCHAHG
jgi:hypothetical protein